MNRGIDHARKLIEMEAKRRGWDSWRKIKEELNLTDLKDKQICINNQFSYKISKQNFGTSILIPLNPPLEKGDFDSTALYSPLF